MSEFEIGEEIVCMNCFGNHVWTGSTSQSIVVYDVQVNSSYYSQIFFFFINFLKLKVV